MSIKLRSFGSIVLKDTNYETFVALKGTLSIQNVSIC